MATNLAILKPSRKRPQVGDAFILRVADGPYLSGRLIRDDANAGGFPNSSLIYIFATRSDEPALIDPAKMVPGNLLVPPIMTNRLPWSRGYFVTLASWPLDEGEALGRHCFESFRDPPRYPNQYFDEYGNRLSRRIEPCGDFGLHSFRTIDDAVSAALGVPLAPD